MCLYPSCGCPVAEAHGNWRDYVSCYPREGTLARDAGNQAVAGVLVPRRTGFTQIRYGSITFREAGEFDPSLIHSAALAGALQAGFRTGFRQRFADFATISDLFLTIQNPGGDPCGGTRFTRFTEHLKWLLRKLTLRGNRPTLYFKEL